MTMLASQITSLTVVYSIVYSGVIQRKHQSSASLAFVREIHRGPVNFPHKWPVTRKMFPFDDVIMVRNDWVLTQTPMCSNRHMQCEFWFTDWILFTNRFWTKIALMIILVNMIILLIEVKVAYRRHTLFHHSLLSCFMSYLSWILPIWDHFGRFCVIYWMPLIPVFYFE